MEMDRRLTIGEFAALTGLTARALRLYAEAGVLAPIEVDATTGYRSYARSQLERAQHVRLLRAAGIAVADLIEVLDVPPARALVRLDEHMSALNASHAQARAAIGLVRARLTTHQGVAMSRTTVRSDLLASAVDAASRCCASDDAGDSPLVGIRLRVDEAGLHFVGSDRYSAAFAEIACNWTASVASERLVPPGFLASAADSWPAVVEVELAEGELRVNGETVPTLDKIFPNVDQFLPHLDRLASGCEVSTADLLAALPDTDGPGDAEPMVELEFVLESQELRMTPRGRRLPLTDRGKSVHLRARGDVVMQKAWVSPARLRTILAGVGDTAVLSLARLEPIAIGDAANPAQRFLLMPMAPMDVADLPAGVSA